MHRPILAPSILSGNHAHLAAAEQIICEVGLQWLHLDIMDGHFVPNLTFGAQTVADLRQHSSLFFDAHLMLDNPQAHVAAFARSGTDLITVHVEPDYPLTDTLKKIEDASCQKGLALNPETPVDTVRPYLDRADLILVMTVQPGFSGQSFQAHTLKKISLLDTWRRTEGFAYRIEVDGGINLNTAKRCAACGADTFVTGTAFFKAKDKRNFTAAIETLFGTIMNRSQNSEVRSQFRAKR